MAGLNFLLAWWAGYSEAKFNLMKGNLKHLCFLNTWMYRLRFMSISNAECLADGKGPLTAA